MVKLCVLSFAVVAALSPLALARNCKTGLNYCGYNLLNIGNYGAQVNEGLEAAGEPTDNGHIRESLFHCDGGANGDITYLTYCGDEKGERKGSSEAMKDVTACTSGSISY
ncbi:conserved hypothetical protein [Paecilomyces variotii No. 5]|uniref:Uncharacterized protein n=1 Tax=Byssochlamys spectabilis (strain No. 5 / NBRC 109023) TaxID=1356009 RepID=V5HSE0_BYSSN|nr:conserved hypothetical protein [Paecilomyces variotii No. 5]